MRKDIENGRSYEDLPGYDRTAIYQPEDFKVGQQVKIRMMQGIREGVLLDTVHPHVSGKVLLALRVPEIQKRRGKEIHKKVKRTYTYSHILNAAIWKVEGVA